MSDYKITIYADSEGPVGHFFVGVTGPGINAPISGKYMKDESIKSLAKSPIGVPGEVRDDADRVDDPSVIKRDIPLTREQAEDAAEYINEARENPGEYELFGKNCIDLAQGALDAAKADKRVDELFTDEELDRMGKSPFGAGDEAQRRGRIVEFDKIEETEKKWQMDNDGSGPQASLDGAKTDGTLTGGSGDDQLADAGTTTGGAASIPSENPETDTAGIISYESLNEGARRVFDSLAPDDGFEQSVDAVSLKDPADMTDGEAKDLVGAYLDRSIGDPERAALQEKAQAFFDVNYGNEPVSMDETGRMQDIKPIRKLPEKPQPAKTAQGGVLADGLKQIAGAVASAAQNNGSGSAVKSLQSGLSLMGANLKVDGDPGPKTKAATVRTIAKQGPGKAREAQALGALNQYAKSVRDQPSKVADLSSTVQSTIKPLVGDTEAAGRVVQVGINDLVQNKVPSTPSPEPPLKEDGDVGPKTQTAFSSALAQHGPDDLTRSIGRVFDFT